MGLLNNIEEVLEEFCDKYCKYSATVFDTNGETLDEAAEQLYEKHCATCPMMKL